MKRRKKSRGSRGLAGTPATHEAAAERYMDASRKALRERRPCAALAEAHKAEVEVKYVRVARLDALLDDLAWLLGEAGTACPCKYERDGRPRHF